MQNSPNPFNPETQVRFGVPRDMDVTLTIYDSAVRLKPPALDREHEGRVPSFTMVCFPICLASATRLRRRAIA